MAARISPDLRRGVVFTRDQCGIPELSVVFRSLINRFLNGLIQQISQFNEMFGSSGDEILMVYLIVTHHIPNAEHADIANRSVLGFKVLFKPLPEEIVDFAGIHASFYKLSHTLFLSSRGYNNLQEKWKKETKIGVPGITGDRRAMVDLSCECISHKYQNAPS